jgi:hypothetical protein
MILQFINAKELFNPSRVDESSIIYLGFHPRLLQLKPFRLFDFKNEGMIYLI